MIPNPKRLRTLLEEHTTYPPSHDQMEDFLYYVQRLRGHFVHYLDHYHRNRYEPPFLFSGRETDFELLWLAYHMAHMTISCGPGEETAPMRVMFETVGLFRVFDPPKELRRSGIKEIPDLMKIKDPRIQFGLSYLFGTGRVNPMNYLANLVERTFRTRPSRRLV
jgi:hypothetical protein